MIRYLLFPVFILYAVLSGITVFPSVVTIVIVGLLVYFKNPVPNQDDANDILQPFKVSVIAHRGAAIDAPENTIAAIREVRIGTACAENNRIQRIANVRVFDIFKFSISCKT